MSTPLDRAKRWSSEAHDLLVDLPDPCTNIDRVATIANALQLSAAAIIEAIDALERPAGPWEDPADTCSVCGGTHDRISRDDAPECYDAWHRALRTAQV